MEKIKGKRDLFKKSLELPNIGLHDWLMTSKQTEPELQPNKWDQVSQ